LELLSSQANASIEKTSHEIISGMPAIANEISIFQNHSKQLKIKMKTLEASIMQSENGFSMENLERLDDLKNKLEGAKNYLEQNDSFTKLTQEVRFR
jgi:Golgi complex component 7 (COG7)